MRSYGNSLGARWAHFLENQVEFDDLKSETYLQVSVSDKSYWIGGENLKVLSRYNKSSFYIIAVFLLSKELAFTINEV